MVTDTSLFILQMASLAAILTMMMMLMTRMIKMMMVMMIIKTMIMVKKLSTVFIVSLLCCPSGSEASTSMAKTGTAPTFPGRHISELRTGYFSGYTSRHQWIKKRLL